MRTLAKAGEMTDAADVRMKLYQLMSGVFRAEPSVEFLLRMKGPSMSGALTDLGVEFDGDFLDCSIEDLENTLAIEFTRLFLGPGPRISPHESIYVEVDGDTGGHWGAKTVEVKRFIEATGIAYAGSFTGLPDHISVELELMAKLIDWELEIRNKDNVDDTRYCLKIQQRFLTEHLMLWAPEFCSDVMAQTNISYFREMAAVCKDFLEEDFLYITDALRSIDQRIA